MVKFIDQIVKANLCMMQDLFHLCTNGPILQKL